MKYLYYSAVAMLFISIISALLLFCCLYKYGYRRIQVVAVPVFVNLNAAKYIVLRQDTLKMAPDCGLPIKKIYYMEKL